MLTGAVLLKGRLIKCLIRRLGLKSAILATNQANIRQQLEKISGCKEAKNSDVAY